MFNKIQYYKITEFTIYQAFIIKRNYILNYKPFKYFEKNTHVWDVPDNFKLMPLLEFNMIGFKFRVIEHIKNNVKLNNELNLILTKK